MEVVKVIRGSRYIKKPKLVSEHEIEIFAPQDLIFKSSEYTQYDTGIVTVLPENVRGYYWSLNNNIIDLTTGENKPHFGFLNQTFTLDFTLQKNATFGFARLFSDTKIKFEHTTKN